MACSQGSLDFAWRQLAALTVLSGLEAEAIYDRALEEVRHALLQLHSWVGRDDARALLPLIDLLTSLHCSSTVPVASGVIAPKGWSWAYSCGRPFKGGVCYLALPGAAGNCAAGHWVEQGVSDMRSAGALAQWPQRPLFGSFCVLRA